MLLLNELRVYSSRSTWQDYEPEVNSTELPEQPVITTEVVEFTEGPNGVLTVNELFALAADPNDSLGALLDPNSMGLIG